MLANVLEKGWIMCMVCIMLLQVVSANDEMKETMEITEALSKMKPKPVTPEVMFSINRGKSIPFIKKFPSFGKWAANKIKRSYKIYDAELLKIAEKVANVGRVCSIICNGQECESTLTSLLGKYHDLLSSIESSSYLLFKDAMSGLAEHKTGLSSSSSWDMADVMRTLQEKHKKKVGDMESNIQPILNELTQYVNKLPAVFTLKTKKADEEKTTQASKLAPLKDSLKSLNDLASKLKSDIKEIEDRFAQLKADKDKKVKEEDKLMEERAEWYQCLQDQRKKGPFYWLTTEASTGKEAFQASPESPSNVELKVKEEIKQDGNKDYALMYLERHSNNKYKIFNKEQKGVLFCSKMKDSNGQPIIEFSRDSNYEEDGREIWEVKSLEDSVYEIKNEKCNKYLCVKLLTDKGDGMVSLSDCTDQDENTQWRLFQDSPNEYGTSTKSPAEACIPTHGPDAGNKCVFPYKYRKKSCPGPMCCNLSKSSKGSWCYTKVDKNGVGVSGKYGFCNGTVCDPDTKAKEDEKRKQLPQEIVQYCGEQVSQDRINSVKQSKRKIEQDISDTEGKIDDLNGEKKQNDVNTYYKKIELANVEKSLKEAKVDHIRWSLGSKGIQLLSRGLCAIKKYLELWKGSGPLNDIMTSTALTPAPSKRDNIIRCGYNVLAYGIASYDTYEEISKAKKAASRAYVENTSPAEKKAILRGSQKLFKDTGTLLDDYIPSDSPCAKAE